MENIYIDRAIKLNDHGTKTKLVTSVEEANIQN